METSRTFSTVVGNLKKKHKNFVANSIDHKEKSFLYHPDRFYPRTELFHIERCGWYSTHSIFTANVF